MNVYAVTVTYANRFPILSKLIRRLVELDVHKIVVVDNGSSIESKQGLHLLNQEYPHKISIVTHATNLGSAGGFKSGLQFAHAQDDCEFIWLLDDDNLPEENSLNALLSTYKNLNIECALVSLRKKRATYRKIRNETDVRRKFKPNNSFIHFSLHHLIFKNIIYSFDNSSHDLIAIPYGPYGGMFFKKNLLDVIGYPNEAMFLYMDDHEFSHRIVKAGMKLFLHRQSIVDDMEESWPGKKKNRFLARFMTAVNGDETKAFYLVRNSIYLERKFFVTHTLEYAINRLIYKAVFYSLCMMTRNRERIDLFRRASGEANKMKIV